MAYPSSVGCDLGGDQPTGYAILSACFHTPEITITPAHRALLARGNAPGGNVRAARWIFYLVLYAAAAGVCTVGLAGRDVNHPGPLGNQLAITLRAAGAKRMGYLYAFTVLEHAS